MAKFVPRQRKHKVLAREKAKENAVTPLDADTNAEQIDPEERRLMREKKERMKKELQGDVKVSGKKAKRLDKYIENKLRKDENREILAKLSQSKIDTNLFTSSKTIGQGKETKRQAISRVMRERKAGVEVDEDGDEILFERPRQQDSSNEALGFKPASESTQILDVPRPDNFTPRAADQEPLPEELQPSVNLTRKAFGVTVTRTPEIQEARLKLPVVGEEQRIMEAIHNHDIIVVCGSTGSGKTTQVPQFLYEAGYGSPDSPTSGMIGVTQPRRVAAVSMSKRVAEEMGDHSERVAYQIRFEGTTSAKTAIKFMTDGVLLREIAQDFSLKKYSAIIIDEAHERSVNTDILIGMLSRINNVRQEDQNGSSPLKPLKIIIMSATLRVEDMTQNSQLFATPPPVVEVEGRQHPVTIHFARRTRPDYVDELYNKISRGHKKLPPGGFLVFLTGQNEIVQLSKRLEAAFGGLTSASGPKVQISASEAPMEVEDIEFGDVDDFDAGEIDDEISDGEGDEDEDEEFKIEEEGETGPLKMQVLPLYSLLPTREQMRVFKEPPEGTRQVILATNVAETSLTIPGTRYVFDCGRSKERQYDEVSGVQTYAIGWVSKASANQRSGRAGRTGPGHCYRLYSSAVYERDLPQFSEPELLRMPIDGVVLQLKSMNLSNVVNFPFPTPPDRASLRKAERLLHYLSAISTEGQVTRIGSTMSIFPLSPRFARILLVGHQHDCLQYTIALVAALSAAEVFIPENQAIPSLEATEDHALRTNAVVAAEDRQATIRRAFNGVQRNFCSLDDKSDAIKLLQVVGEYAHEPTEAWCESHFVRYKVLKEIQQLRQQIVELLRTNVPSFQNLRFQDRLDRPTDRQVAYLKQMVAAGFIDQVAIRADKSPTPPENARKPRRAIDVPYLPLVPLGVGADVEKFVYLHPSSPLAHMSPQELPEYVVYAYLQRATQGVDPTKTPKTRMHALTDVTGGQLAGLAKGTPLLTYGKPVKEVRATATEREVWVVPYLRAEGVGGSGWPLPMKKVIEKREVGKGWVVQ
ncbi:ATP-dependent RNA helicase DHX8 [Verticillium alfalfae VaMs.102]|uniref:RNA helicase n=1 Tax=Verticillium alfalfae (strain VaMs.102 / ATCC MYA-4576 / FGSC 10136) TaxID=526221 RepID=C9S8L4_VERA1|nr:ATP-dependent RNA helicase DHX8 [Verticillium alfalfae VaMs.102]EEY13975.1 ATP-dependent RNA helicase DHX8 [Verticillium alfalfae VaMs.102]